jgi:hypothetical protein
MAIPWPYSELLHKGLERKAHRICMSKSEDLERKARFAAFYAANVPKF